MTAFWKSIPSCIRSAALLSHGRIPLLSKTMAYASSTDVVALVPGTLKQPSPSHASTTSLHFVADTELQELSDTMLITDEVYPTHSYDEFDVVLSDINHEELVMLGRGDGVGNLCTGKFPSTPFPVSGRIHGPFCRYMAPLICRRPGKVNAPVLNVWFFIDTGSPYTCLSSRSLEALLGTETLTSTLYRISIQDPGTSVDVRVSKAHFADINILGTDFMRHFELSINVDWRKRTFELVKL